MIVAGGRVSLAFKNKEFSGWGAVTPGVLVFTRHRYEVPSCPPREMQPMALFKAKNLTFVTAQRE